MANEKKIKKLVADFIDSKGNAVIIATTDPPMDDAMTAMELGHTYFSQAHLYRHLSKQPHGKRKN